MRNYTLNPENTVQQSMLNCQLQQIASKAAQLVYFSPKEKQGRRQVENGIKMMVEMLDE